MGSDEHGFWHLISTLGSSLIASSAYQKWPTKNDAFYPAVQLSQLRVLTNLKFENRSRALRPRFL